MKLKRYILAAFIATAGLLAAGCSDWLDYTPKDKQSYEQQFNTIAGFHSAVNGVYTQMTSSSLYGQNLSYGAIDILGLCYSISSSNKNLYEICEANYSGSYASSVFSTIWTKAYNTLLNINLVLEALEEFPNVLDPDDAQLIKAEMLALRAYIHFDLVRLYGPIYSNNPDAPSVPFANSSEVLKREQLGANDILTNKILPDIIEAQELLSEVDPILTSGVLNYEGENGNWWHYRQLRMNYYAVTLLKARVHQWMGDDDNAIAETEKITDSPKVAETFPWVVPNRLLSNNINPDRMFSTECLFGFYKNNIENIYKDSFSGTLDHTYVMQPRNGYVGLLFSSTADYRRQSQWAVSAAAGGSDFDFIKYKSFTANKETPEFWASFYGLMRISEAYYIAAEAWLNKGDKIKAGEYLSKVLEARGVGELDTEFMNEKLVRNEIIYEYLREMRGEGQIFFLHKRHEQHFGSGNGGTPNFDASGYSVSSDVPAVSVRYIVPIPSGEKY